MLKLKYRKVDVELGHPEIFLHEKDADHLGLQALDRAKVAQNGQVPVVAVVDITRSLVKPGEVGLSAEIYDLLAPKGDEPVTIVPAPKPRSVEYIRKKLDGAELTQKEIRAIVEDIANGELSDIELTAYCTAIYVHDMSVDEIVHMIDAMVETGETLEIKANPIMDVHSIGGVPGNKYAPLTVSIVAANGLCIPKTSSRAISSACGTADFMEVVAPVEHDAQKIEEIAEKTGGTMVWGGGVNLAPADDAIIRVEYPLRIDPHGQIIASVMAKKKAVGAQYVVIDIPVGEGTKIDTEEKARQMARDFIKVGERIGIKTQAAITYGGQPLGKAIGPALEIREALQVLEGAETPSSLIQKACSLGGILLELGGKAEKGKGYALARETLRSGAALAKFKEIIAAQGGDPTVSSKSIRIGAHSHEVKTDQNGYVEMLDNKALVRIARACGAPRDKGAGIYLNVKKSRRVEPGDTILTLYAEHAGKLQEAIELTRHLRPVRIEGMIIEEVME